MPPRFFGVDGGLPVGHQAAGGGSHLSIGRQHQPQFAAAWGSARASYTMSVRALPDRRDEVVGTVVADGMGRHPYAEEDAVHLRPLVVVVVDPPEGVQNGRVRCPDHAKIVQFHLTHAPPPAAEPASPQQPGADRVHGVADAEAGQCRAGVGGWSRDVLDAEPVKPWEPGWQQGAGDGREMTFPSISTGILPSKARKSSSAG